MFRVQSMLPYEELQNSQITWDKTINRWEGKYDFKAAIIKMLKWIILNPEINFKIASISKEVDMK